jgi:hypothetical protein
MMIVNARQVKRKAKMSLRDKQVRKIGVCLHLCQKMTHHVCANLASTSSSQGKAKTNAKETLNLNLLPILGHITINTGLYYLHHLDEPVLWSIV